MTSLRLAPVLAALLAAGLAGSALAQSPELVPIGKVQGRGAVSPLIGQQVDVAGIATATLRGPGGAAGWFLQDAGDGDAATPDALFVTGETAPAPGTRVRLRGTVAELDAGRGRTRTALVRAEVLSLQRDRLPKPLPLRQAPADWAPYEGMRVRIDAPLAVVATHRLEHEGVLWAAFGERPRTPTDVAAPGPAAQAVAADNARRTLRLDDADVSENPPAPWYLPGGAPRAGGVLRGVEGVVDVRDGGWRLQLTAVPTLRPAKAPPAPRVRGNVRIAALNLENLFNGDGRGGGFPTPRGARSAAELQAQLAKHVLTLRGLDADIVALMELENDGDGPDSAMAALLAALNRDGSDWRGVATGAPVGSDQIRVALIYRAGRVAPVGAPATLTGVPFERGNRVPLAQSFRAGSGPVFTVVANHFKSKGCGEATGAEADQRDGQSCWNPTRVQAARALHDWLRGDPTRSGSDLMAILGDLNAYAEEDPIRVLREAGWRDAFATTAGATPSYSYLFDGQLGRLDHALLSPSLAARLAGAAKWHTNADEPETQGYPAAATNRAPATPWRSSDHDPLLLGLRLR